MTNKKITLILDLLELEDHGMHNKLVYYGDDKARK